ncbi:Site-specific DNA recombinase [Anaerovibrio lipolyticus DSM 3074]|uniref:Site-specific DNA recombinase n=1 Tax=Anaerovibrio lipolyticus DSM 3074 TaxID=1120997 RepID=A0A1M6GC74_9FIRM|nr:recombinase family protein [Anaerovibrio lipolyticus]SHJ07535.1 Site-specific DNA recombinase [Anaerovibrio lipolyticus DSM 3074]
MAGNVYGYVRVSTASQHDDRQRLAMTEFGIPEENIYADKQSGKDFFRPAYKILMTKLLAGDVLVIQNIDRLGRNYSEILKEWRIITEEKEVAIVVLEMPLLDTRNKYKNDITGKLISNIVLQLFSYVAQREREMNIERTKQGIEAARARGVQFGRKRIEKPAMFEQILLKWQQGEFSERMAAKMLGVSRPTFHKWVHE